MRISFFIAILLISIVRAFTGSSPSGPSSAPSPGAGTASGLVVRHEANRVLMAWRGPVEAPMKQRFEEAFRALGSQPRKVLISWDSPGGRVEHGHEVIKVIHAASRVHYIDTTVGAGAMCASMCVPLYLTGMERTAHSRARFMFHEVILKLRPEAEKAVRQMRAIAPDVVAGAQRQAVRHFTDELFEDGFESKLNNKWLADLRKRIKGRDVWLTGRQLIDEKSGVVDKLI